MAGAQIELFITRLVYAVDYEAIASKYGKPVAEAASLLFGTRDHATLHAALTKSNGLLLLSLPISTRR